MAPAECDALIAEFVGAKKLCTEMDGLCRKGDEKRVGFELRLAGAKNVKAARALLANYDDVEKLKAAEPWLLAPAPPASTGVMGSRARAQPRMRSPL